MPEIKLLQLIFMMLFRFISYQEARKIARNLMNWENLL